MSLKYWKFTWLNAYSKLNTLYTWWFRLQFLLTELNGSASDTSWDVLLFSLIGNSSSWRYTVLLNVLSSRDCGDKI